jgi:mannose-6-phosphate isomerase-like protein (cupin superfamily)
VNSPAHFSHGGLLTRAILRPGDPYKPGDVGAVLEYRKLLALATLPVRNSTPLMALPDQYLFYVTSGEGRLEDGKQFWDLRKNVAMLIPPNAQRRFVNTADSPLTMVMLQWEPSAPPRADILVRDVDKLGYCEENAHWSNMSKCIFRAGDGLLGNERMFLVQLQPWTMSAPHTHGPGTEEVWVKLSPGTAIATLGSELREMPQYAAYLAPPTGFTQHGQINLSKENVEGWLYIARGAGGTAPRAGGPAAPGTTPAPGRGGRGNPNLFTDPATIDGATMRGQPIR